MLTQAAHHYSLDVSDMGTTTLPAGLFEAPVLISVNLDGNAIDALPVAVDSCRSSQRWSALARLCLLCARKQGEGVLKCTIVTAGF